MRSLIALVLVALFALVGCNTGEPAVDTTTKTDAVGDAKKADATKADAKAVDAKPADAAKPAPDAAKTDAKASDAKPAGG